MDSQRPEPVSYPDPALFPGADVASGARCGWVLHQAPYSRSCSSAFPGMDAQKEVGAEAVPSPAVAG